MLIKLDTEASAPTRGKVKTKDISKIALPCILWKSSFPDPCNALETSQRPIIMNFVEEIMEVSIDTFSFYETSFNKYLYTLNEKLYSNMTVEVLRSTR